ncbi:hypothetical protein DEO72_LG8g1571 [Vigna unguiculata]|uniref:Uncharacterized protein n=1 Tax=Vigna unguiculata TaxID=3917 RepID=A0A4D6MPZ8_VIGUN|nr:hypothetical protein DEO72_LG8g1571 [Vigna unguiculata]
MGVSILIGKDSSASRRFKQFLAAYEDLGVLLLEWVHSLKMDLLEQMGKGKSLDAEVDSLEANIKDLEAEASFFNATASRVAEETYMYTVSELSEREKHVESIYPSEKIPVGSKEKPPQSTMT